MRLNRADKWPLYFSLILIGLGTFIIYKDIVNHSFLYWDDNYYIRDNPYLHSFSLQNIAWMFTSSHLANWHPLTWLSLAANFITTGDNPLYFKITNILIHLSTSFVLLLLSITLLQTVKQNYFKEQSFILTNTQILGAGLISCMLYAIHPQHTESVLWISERKDVLCGLFYFLALHFYLRHANSGSKRDQHLVSLFFICALMSKSMAVTLPLALILLDLYPLNRYQKNLPLRQNAVLLLRNKWFYFALCLVVAIITVVTQRNEIHDFDSLPIFPRTVNTSIALLKYMGDILYPAELSAFYPQHALVSDPSLISLAPPLLLIAIAVTAFKLYQRGYYAPVAAFGFFLITVLPVAGIIKIGDASMADRYSYIPTSSFYVLAGVAFMAIWSRLQAYKKWILPIPIWPHITTCRVIQRKVNKN